MRFSDIVNAIRLQVSASVLPECKWYIVVIYTAVLCLMLVRLYTGESLRYWLFARTLDAQRVFYEAEHRIPPNIRVSIHFIAVILTLMINLLPLFLPLVMSGILSRLHNQQRTQQNAG